MLKFDFPKEQLKTEKLNILADVIKGEAKQFKNLARENKKKHMWENYKMIVIGCVSITIISSIDF